MLNKIINSNLTGTKDMKIEIQPNGIWYHGSNKKFSKLRAGSTITQ